MSVRPNTAAEVSTPPGSPQSPDPGHDQEDRLERHRHLDRREEVERAALIRLSRARLAAAAPDRECDERDPDQSRRKQVSEEMAGHRQAQHRGDGEHAGEEHGTRGEDADRQTARVLRSRAAPAAERQRHRGGRHQSAEQPGEAIAPLGAARAASEVAQEVEPRYKEHHGPELAGADGAVRPVGTDRQQREHDQSQDREPERRVELHLSDVPHPLLDSALLRQGERGHHGDPATQAPIA